MQFTDGVIDYKALVEGAEKEHAENEEIAKAELKRMREAKAKEGKALNDLMGKLAEHNEQKRKAELERQVKEAEAEARLRTEKEFEEDEASRNIREGLHSLVKDIRKNNLGI